MLKYLSVESTPKGPSDILTQHGHGGLDSTKADEKVNHAPESGTEPAINSHLSTAQGPGTASNNGGVHEAILETSNESPDRIDVNEKNSPNTSHEKLSSQEDSETKETPPSKADGLSNSDAPGKDDSKPEDEGTAEPPYSVLSEPAKISIILTASFAAIISPISGSIYFPAINSLAHDLHVSTSLINLTVTTYLIFQGLAPSLIGNFSDNNGRRPAYIICFIIYLIANIALALQNSYPALMVLRCLQSSGSSGTIALGSAVVADVSTRAERGKYIGYATMGVTLGPALGPIIGGLLDQYLGWRAIFWFLSIFAAVFFIIVVLVMPETARTIVGNGSITPSKWQLSVWQLVRGNHKQNDNVPPDENTIKQRRRTNLLSSLLIARNPEDALILAYGSLLYAGYFSVLSTLSNQLQARYGFDSLHIGLCYLPLGFGSLTSRWTVGRILDRNFHRLATLHGIPITRNRQQDISKFPIETARLQVSLPLVYASCLCIVAYAWVMDHKTALAGPLVMLFFTGHFTTGAFSALNTLIVDINHDTPATAVAANNLFRCLLGAGATAVTNPLIERIGIGWTGTFIAFLWLVFSPALWAVLRLGPGWRKEAWEREERRREKMEKKKARVDPKVRRRLRTERGEGSVVGGEEKTGTEGREKEPLGGRDAEERPNEAETEMAKGEIESIESTPKATIPQDIAEKNNQEATTSDIDGKIGESTAQGSGEKTKGDPRC